MVADLQVRAETRERELEAAKNDAEKSKNDAEKAAQNEHASLRKSIVRLLALRDVKCSPENLARLDACTSRDTLNQWLDRAFEATSEADVFGG
jgi:hypothetical protein